MRAEERHLQELTIWALVRSRVWLLAFAVLMIAINRGAALVWPYLSKYLVDDVFTRHSQSMLVVVVVAGAGATLIQGVSSYLINRTVNLSALRLVADLRKAVYDHVLRLSIAYYDAATSGSMVSRIMNDVDGVRSLFGGGLVTFLGGLFTACMALVVLIRINAAMTFIVFSALLLFGLLVRSGVRRSRPLYREANAIRGELSGRLTESLGGVRVVRAYRAEPREHREFCSRVDSHLERVSSATKRQGFLDLSVIAMSGVVSASVTYFGGMAVMSGHMTFGEFFRYVMFVGVLFNPLLQAVSIGTQFNEAFAGLERLNDLLAEPREGHNKRRSLCLERMRGEVCFESVSFAYGGQAPVLHEVSFRTQPGTVTALVGPSGSGKSTIIGLIAGFYEACKGTVLVDDADLSRVDLDSYRAHLAIVPQDPFLFSGTIRDNILISRPNASHEEIVGACRLARVDEFATRLRDQYETVVGERGVKLSMGQRQRIAIARAILADPRILILDEATSSLDSVSEAMIQQALSFLLRDRSTFVIAHRLSTIRLADQILVIDGGRIVERGSHDSLFGAKGKYWELYTTQYELQSNLLLAPGEDEATVPAPASEASYVGIDE